MSDRIVIDLRRKAEAYVELVADLVIEIDRYECSDGYTVRYVYDVPGFVYLPLPMTMTRAEMVLMHVTKIQQIRPKTVVIRTGKHSTGQVVDVAIHPGVVKSIIEGKLTAAELTLRD